MKHMERRVNFKFTYSEKPSKIVVQILSVLYGCSPCCQHQRSHNMLCYPATIYLVTVHFTRSEVPFVFCTWTQVGTDQFSLSKRS